jgi:hypothetical protein
MENIIAALKNTWGIFSRASGLRNDPLLADIYEEITDLDKLRYMGPETDRENFRKDMRNWASDFGKASTAARQKLGI